MDKIMGMLGLARRGGFLELGHACVVTAVIRGKSQLVLMAKDLSSRSRDNVGGACAKAGVRVLDIDYTMDEIHALLGKRVGIISLNNKGMANKIIELSQLPMH